MGLDGVRVGRLTKDLQQRGIRDEKEAGEDEPLLLEVARQGLLADLELLEQVRQQLRERLVADAAVDHVGGLVRPLHDLLPRLVDVAEALGLLRQLLGDVAADEHGLQVDPQVLHHHPVLDDLGGGGELLHPLLDGLLERRVVAVAHERAQHHQRVLHQRDYLGRHVSLQQQLAARLEVTELKVLVAPVRDHLFFSFGINIKKFKIF